MCSELCRCRFSNVKVCVRDVFAGGPTIVYGYVSDCTDLKNKEEKTKNIQDVYRFTVNHDYEWILLVDIPADRYEYFFRVGTA